MIFSCGTWASCPKACRILVPRSGTKLYVLLWEVDFLKMDHREIHDLNEPFYGTFTIIISIFSKMFYLFFSHPQILTSWVKSHITAAMFSLLLPPVVLSHLLMSHVTFPPSIFLIYVLFPLSSLILKFLKVKICLCFPFNV